jgi:hypothetical protein
MLSASLKQVRWAEAIRAALWPAIASYVASLASATNAPADLRDRYRGVLLSFNMKPARWWIDHRGQSATAIVDEHVSSFRPVPKPWFPDGGTGSDSPTKPPD